MSPGTVAAVIATYNRRELLTRCLDALLRQTRAADTIYIIDNASTDGTYGYLVQQGFLPADDGRESGPVERTVLVPSRHRGDHQVRIQYVQMSDNTGGAGAFHEGIRRASGEGYDWLWLMDDDGEPARDALERLIEAQDEFGAWVLNCAVVAPDGESLALGYMMYEGDDRRSGMRTIWRLSDIELNDRRLSNGIANFFNGSLINKRVIEAVGFPKKEFFIAGDEMDFCCRVQDAGFKTYTVPNALLTHPKQERKRLRVLGGVLVLPPWKLYYAVRNSLYLERTYKLHKHPYLRFLGRCAKYLLISLLVGERKARSLYCLFLAFLDGVRERIYVNHRIMGRGPGLRRATKASR